MKKLLVALTAVVALSVTASVADAYTVYRCKHNGVWHAGRCPAYRNGHANHVRCTHNGHYTHSVIGGYC